MAKPRAGDRFRDNIGVMEAHFGRFLTDVGEMEIFVNFEFF